MAVSGAQVAVTNAPTALNTAGDGGFLTVSAASATVTVGSSTVTANNGLVVTTTTVPVVIPIKQGQVLYGITATTANLSVLIT